MGGVIGVKDPYEYSNSVEVDDFDKKRSDNNINSINNNMTVTLPSSSMQTTTTAMDKIQPVRMHVLDVPLIERHPFQEYRFSKKLGE